MIVAATAAALAPPPCPRTFADGTTGARPPRHAREQEWRLVSDRIAVSSA